MSRCAMLEPNLSAAKARQNTGREKRKETYLCTYATIGFTDWVDVQICPGERQGNAEVVDELHGHVWSWAPARA